MKALRRSCRLVAGHGSPVSRRAHRGPRYGQSEGKLDADSGQHQSYSRFTVLASSSIAATGLVFLSQEQKEETEHPSSTAVTSRYADKKAMLEVDFDDSRILTQLIENYRPCRKSSRF